MTFWRLYYHIVWATKNREPLIQDEWRAELYKVMVAKAQQLGARVYALGGTADHVHLVASVPPKVALSAFVGQVKGSSSHFANGELGLPYTFAWQPQFGVMSFGQKRLGQVVAYVRNQEAHHEDATDIALLEVTAHE